MDSWIQPSDVLTAAATLLGLLLAAISLSSAFPGTLAIIRTLSVGLVLIVILFAGAALATCVASLRQSHRILKLAVVVFAAGWTFTGIVLCLLLVGYAWGIEIFQIPVVSIPQFVSLNIESILSILGAIFSFLAVLYSYRRTRTTQHFEELASSLGADRKKKQAIVRESLDVDKKDPKMAFVRLTIDLEQALREMAVAHGYPEKDVRRASWRAITNYLRSKQALDDSTLRPIDQIRYVRNMVLHSGADISDRDAAAAVDLAAAVLSRLRTTNSDNSDRGTTLA